MVTRGTNERHEKPTKLVLTRRVGEGIIATLEDGREVRFVIERINGQGASISISGPRSIGFLRDELEGLEPPPHSAGKRSAVA
jgi:sRNA-binding carbon storage regulator CsrA